MVNCRDLTVVSAAHQVISARAGTLKRKQQVRQFLEAMPREDVEDGFSSAYMQSKRFEVCFRLRFSKNASIADDAATQTDADNRSLPGYVDA